MSGPVPSPSMNGITGLSGTLSFPSLRVIASPVVGALRFLKEGVVMAQPISTGPPSRRRLRERAAVLPDRDPSTHLVEEAEVDRCDRDAVPVAALRDHGAPRIDDHGVSVR